MRNLSNKTIIFIMHAIAILAIAIILYYIERFEQEYQITINVMKWHVLAVFFVQIIIITILGVLATAILYSIGFTLLPIKINERIKAISFILFKLKYKNKNISIYNYRGKAKSINSSKKIKSMLILITIITMLSSLIPLIFFTTTNEQIEKLFPIFGITFVTLIFTTLIFSIIILFILETSNDKHVRRAVYKNKGIKNKSLFLNITKYVRNPILFIFSWMFLLSITSAFRSNGVDPMTVFAFILLMVGIVYIIISTDKTITKILLFLTITTIFLFSPLSYILFKNSLNENVYTSHNNNYILIDKQCYNSNKTLLDLNKLATPYESSNSYYYINHFSKFINSKRIIIDEKPNFNLGKNEIYFVDLINCKDITVQDCINDFNKDKCKIKS